jgi:tRNA threonylcarbamoyl adenosine modification protein YeaZ
MLLAIDTSAGTSVAVVDRDAGIIAEASSDDTRAHAEVIGELIATVLKESGVAVSDLSGVVAGMGPGPFTGLRVGIAAARAFALGAGKIVVPVVSHDAVAYGIAEPVIIATDARRQEVFWSAYSAADDEGFPVRIAGPALAKVDEFDAVLAQYPDHRLIRAETVSAGSLGMLAETLYAARRPFAPNEPIYLRSPDITVSSGPKRVTS